MYNTNNIIQWAHYPVLPEAGVEYFVGLDLGQAQDYTAVAILEKREIVLRERDPVTWELQRQTSHMVRDIKRAPLNTPYTESWTASNASCGRPPSTAGPRSLSMPPAWAAASLT